jgi:hypothetical protein
VWTEVGANRLEPLSLRQQAPHRMWTQWSITPTAVFTDPCFREPCGQLKWGSRVYEGGSECTRTCGIFCVREELIIGDAENNYSWN